MKRCADCGCPVPGQLPCGESAELAGLTQLGPGRGQPDAQAFAAAQWALGIIWAAEPLTEVRHHS